MSASIQPALPAHGDFLGHPKAVYICFVTEMWERCSFYGMKALLLLYLVSPFDLIPETIPVFGIVDDLVILPVAIRWMLDRLPPGLRRSRPHRRSSAVSAEHCLRNRSIRAARLPTM